MATNKIPYASTLQKHLNKIKVECQGISNIAAIHDVHPEYVKATEDALRALTRSVVKDLKTKKEAVTVDLADLIGEKSDQKESDDGLATSDVEETSDGEYGEAADIDKAAS
tara:strand:+ start:949 stop:1281 length:333 start_codon:yes stop_codon:yes gene_type:complete